jgi:hypothetical protein
MNYISVLERYHEYERTIQEIMSSILSGIVEDPLITDKSTRCKAMQALGKRFPFLEVLFVLDKDGIQQGDNVAVESSYPGAYQGDGVSRRQRPYYQLASGKDEIVVTAPYLSIVSRSLCISACMRLGNGDTKGYIVLDADLMAIVEFLMGDAKRRRFQPFFKGIYGLIVTGLFIVVTVLLYSAFHELYLLTHSSTSVKETQLKPFGVIIFLTLALAIFDLGKTTLEEEVLMHKDIFRHSSTRRTITRFVAAILIAVSIEALLLMFKSALGDGEALLSAVGMMLTAVGLLVGLGLYVYLGAKAEALLNQRS